jgi:hypothetical protein
MKAGDIRPGVSYVHYDDNKYLHYLGGYRRNTSWPLRYYNSFTLL